MRQTFALLSIGMILLLAWVAMLQVSRALARANARRRRRALRICSVVAGTPAPAPDEPVSLDQADAEPVPSNDMRTDCLYLVGEFAAAAREFSRHARS